MSHCDTPDTLLHACLENDIARLAIATRPDLLNAPVLDGLLPLQVAATAGHSEAVRALVERGARVDATDNAATGQNTALHFAVLARRGGAVNTLLDLGADPNAVNCVGTTPVHDAGRVGDIRIAEALKDNGADLMLFNGYGNTVLHRACLHNNHDMVLWILRSVAPPHRAALLAMRNHAHYNVQDIALSRRLGPMARLLDSLGARRSQRMATLAGGPYTELHGWKAFLRETAEAAV